MGSQLGNPTHIWLWGNTSNEERVSLDDASRSGRSDTGGTSVLAGRCKSDDAFLVS